MNNPKLSDLLLRLNVAIHNWNRDLAEAVDRGEVDQAAAAKLRCEENSATVQLALGGVWPANLARALADLVSEEDPKEIIRMAKSLATPTELTQELLHGSASSKQQTPVLVPTLSLAHLVAMAG